MFLISIRPIGGNFWSNWTGPDANNDRFVDNPYSFTGGADNLPWAAKNGWMDSIAPITTINLSGTLGENDWYTSAVEISFLAEDNAGGTSVDKIQYSWDGLTWLLYSAPLAISDNGIKKIYYRSADKTGNTETAQSKDINIDTIAPQSDASFTGNIGTNNWYTSNVAAVINSVDNPNGSGIDTIEYSYNNAVLNIYSSVLTISNEGSATVYYRSKDKAGNAEIIASRAISIDKTLPIIAGKTIQQPNINNWFNQNVTIEFLCTDAISGALNPIINNYLSAEGIGQSSRGNCIDQAGNSSSLTIDGINIDKTNPQVSVVRSPEPNAKGWNNSAVIATFVATDSLSNIDGSSTSIVSFNQEGAGQEAIRTFKDKAGNEITGSISGINIDLTKPIISGSAISSPNANGWYNTNVTVHFIGSDDLSGISSLSPDIIISGEGSGQETTGAATDNADNSSSFTVSEISIDKTSPIITVSPTSSANSNNWYNSNVSIEFSAIDILSGISNISPITVISQEGLGQSASGSADDKAGNSSPTIINGINLDTTAPSKMSLLIALF